MQRKKNFDLNFTFFGVDYFKISKVLEKTNNFLKCLPRFQYDFFKPLKYTHYFNMEYIQQD